VSVRRAVSLGVRASPSPLAPRRVQAPFCSRRRIDEDRFGNILSGFRGSGLAPDPRQGRCSRAETPKGSRPTPSALWGFAPPAPERSSGARDPTPGASALRGSALVLTHPTTFQEEDDGSYIENS